MLEFSKFALPPPAGELVSSVQIPLTEEVSPTTFRLPDRFSGKPPRAWMPRVQNITEDEQ